MQDMIKGAGTLTGWTLDSHTRGMEALRRYTSTGDCRHAALVNFFQPGTLDINGPCQGGCDNCMRRCAGMAGVSSFVLTASDVATCPGLRPGIAPPVGVLFTVQQTGQS
jgi:hypothetical protein